MTYHIRARMRNRRTVRSHNPWLFVAGEELVSDRGIATAFTEDEADARLVEWAGTYGTFEFQKVEWQ